jgi:hypothetical protein
MQRALIPTGVLLTVFLFAGAAFSQCRTMDKNIEKPVKVVRGTPTIIRDTIRLCTSHVFHFKGVRNQTMSVKLVTGKKTAITLLPPSGDALIDGGSEWNGRLTESGVYELQIGTDVTARYTLEISIK